MYQVCKTFSFDAAHLLRDYDGKCARLHGHRWEVAICVEGQALDPIGMLVDFGVLKIAAQQATANYDHNMLNDIPPYTEINPTAENIAHTIFQAVRAELATHAPAAHLAYVQVRESPTSWAKYWE